MGCNASLEIDPKDHILEISDVEFKEIELGNKLFEDYIEISDGIKYKGNTLKLMNNVNYSYPNRFKYDNQEYVCNGEGELKIENNFIYSGNFKNGYFHKLGKIVYQNGDFYEGNYFYGKKNGKGKESINSLEYEGNYKNDVKFGEGKLELKDNFIYEGNFVNNSFTGLGTMKWPDGKEYKGYWYNNKFEGEGEYYFNNELSYKGYYIKNKKHGKGEINCINLNYKGEWKHGKSINKGKIFENNEEIYEGVWENDKFV